MAVRYGANGQPMPDKKPETIQEILEVNPNTVEEVEEENLSSDWEAEEEETDEEL